MKIIETDRLILRTLKNEDIDSVMNFWGNEEVMKYCGGAGDKNMELNSIKYYTNLQRERGYSPLVVILKENNEIIGACGFNPTNNKDEIELIYHFKKNQWGKGFASEASRACISYASNNLKIKKIIAIVDLRNIASKKVLEKLGFKFIKVQFSERTKQDELYFELEV